MASRSILMEDIKRQMAVYHCQVSLTFIYPLYIFGVLSLSGTNQAIFVIVLPIIKLIAKTWISRALSNQHNLKSEAVISNVEVFNALYVSNAFQNASSWTSTARIMVVDIVHFWLSMLDVVDIINDVKALMVKTPVDHPDARENFMQLALKKITINEKIDGTNSRRGDDDGIAKLAPAELLANFTSTWHDKAFDVVRRPEPNALNPVMSSPLVKSP
ncbi:unnamed protein product [Phytophthora lilii]|uniref:Unnamed protein product n=1 Tax=Phytophthora lilii TaxID=2077276 RepID=A0A9W6XFB0_9STRA|nr:unnamed protein product [Phytophthora lilii]